MGLFAEDAHRLGEEAKWLAQDAVRGLDVDRISRDAMLAAQDAVRGLGVQRISDDARWAAQGGYRAQWIQGDPADSLYQLGREAMSRTDYSRAAARFAEVLAKYPNYRRVAETAYWEAFSRYRVGTLESLRQGLKVLEANASRLAYDSRGTDAPALQGRILRALAARNEPGADAKLRDLFARYPAASCDTEDRSIKSQVLNSLYQSDPEAATPYIRRYLETRDSCSAELRRTALFLLAHRPTEEKTGIIISVAKHDTVKSVRERAIDLLSKMPGDGAVNALQELMRDPDERVQRAAVRSLMRSDNTRARGALRSAMLDRRDAPENQRLEAIRSYDRDNTTPEDAAYLRNLYSRKDESERVKEAVVSTISRIPSEENVNFLLGIAKNPNEPSMLRSQALRSISRTTLSIDDLIKLYDASDSRSMRQSLVDALADRNEDAAINKLLDIVRYSTDPEVRSRTIQILLNKRDPAIQKRLLDLIK